MSGNLSSVQTVNTPIEKLFPGVDKDDIKNAIDKGLQDYLKNGNVVKAGLAMYKDLKAVSDQKNGQIRIMGGSSFGGTPSPEMIMEAAKAIFSTGLNISFGQDPAQAFEQALRQRPQNFWSTSIKTNALDAQRELKAQPRAF